MGPPRIKFPDRAKVGDFISIKTVASHPMESGNRRDADGRPIARNIIHTFEARFAGALVFKAALGSGISANPFVSFCMRVAGPGNFTFTWIDDAGVVVEETMPLLIES